MSQDKTSYKVCEVCRMFVGDKHECEVSRKLLENPKDLKAPYLTAKAIPTRTGPDA